MKNKYRTEAEDIALGMEMHKVESEPFEARLWFYISAGNYPQVDVCIELRDGLDRHWRGEHDSYPIYNVGKYQAIERLKYWVKKNYPSVQVIKSDYSEVKGYHPTYIREVSSWYSWSYGSRYHWVGTWLPI